MGLACPRGSARSPASLGGMTHSPGGLGEAHSLSEPHFSVCKMNRDGKVISNVPSRSEIAGT